MLAPADGQPGAVQLLRLRAGRQADGGHITRENEFEPVNTNDFNNSIDNMLFDYQGNLWFTSSRLGLLRLAKSAFKDIYGTIGMDRRVVNTIVSWQDCYKYRCSASAE